jgi:hypothetical protein
MLLRVVVAERGLGRSAVAQRGMQAKLVSIRDTLIAAHHVRV